MAKTLEVIDGAECSVETGLGVIKAVERAEGKRNAHVTIEAEHLRLPVKAWADMEDHRLVGPLLAALDAGAQVAYRIVVKRKRNIDAALPWSEVGQYDRVRDLASVEPGGSLTPPRSLEGSICHRVLPNGSASGAQEAQEAQERQEPTDAASGPPEAPAPPERRRAMVTEARPWEPTNTDGSLNLGSYEVLAAVSMVDLAHEMLLEHATAAGETSTVLPSMGQIKALAHSLLTAADQAQAGVRADGRVNRMDSSHARARGAVRTALEAEPVPWGATPGVRQAWVGRLAQRACDLLAVAIELAQ